MHNSGVSAGYVFQPTKAPIIFTSTLLLFAQATPFYADLTSGRFSFALLFAHDRDRQVCLSYSRNFDTIHPTHPLLT